MAYLGSSIFFSQANHDATANRNPSSAHFNGAMLLVVFVAICVGVLVHLIRTDYLLARALLASGIPATGVVEAVSRTIDNGFRQYHVTTIDYRYVASDGKTYRGSSVTKAKNWHPIVRGAPVEILHHRLRPNVHGWRAALQLKATDAEAGIFAASLILPWVLLLLYRYFRWLCTPLRDSQIALRDRPTSSTAP